jgi:radical SAM protein with 4Fe4S-binding SPASM domain
MYDHLQRGALLAGRLARANVGRLTYPLKLNLALTYWCQYKCKTCNIWKRRPTDELTTAEIVTFVRENPAVSWLDVTGGEIFLRDDITDIFDAIVDSWQDLFILHFPTNGFLTNQIVGLAERVARSRVPHVIVTVSIDGDEAMNDDVRGIKGGFRRQVETLNALRRIDGIRAVVGMTLSRFNVGHVERTFDAIRAECPGLEMSDFHVNFAQVSDHYYANAGDAVVAPRDAALRELRWYRDRRGNGRTPADWVEGKFLRELESFLQTGRTPMPCHSLRSSCFIDPWGTVFPCITYSRPLGRLRETGMRLAPIWNSEDTRTTQHEIWSGDCPQCWTACEAYHTILGNLARPFAGPATPPIGIDSSDPRRVPLTRIGD